MNRYDVTHLIWSLLAPHKSVCRLEMCWLRHQYPATNHSTKLKFASKADCLTVIRGLEDKLFKLGWEISSDSRSGCRRFSKSEGSKQCFLSVDYGDTTGTITPFFYATTRKPTR